MSFEITNWGGETMGTFLTLEGAMTWLSHNGIRGDAIWDTELDNPEDPVYEIL